MFNFTCLFQKCLGQRSICNATHKVAEKIRQLRTKNMKEKKSVYSSNHISIYE